MRGGEVGMVSAPARRQGTRRVSGVVGRVKGMLVHRVEGMVVECGGWESGLAWPTSMEDQVLACTSWPCRHDSVC